jgi:hypothetical protein
MTAVVIALTALYADAQMQTAASPSPSQSSSGKWVQQPVPRAQQGAASPASGAQGADARQRMANLAREGESLGWFADRAQPSAQSGREQQMNPPAAGYQRPYAQGSKGQYWPSVSKQQVAPYWPQWPGERYQPGQETQDYSRGYPGQQYRQPTQRETESEELQGRAEAGTQERIRRGQEQAQDHFMERKEAADREAMREEARAQAEERRRGEYGPEEEEY